MSDSNRTRIAFVEETVFGTTPTTPTLVVANITSHRLAPQIQYIESRTIRSDRNVPDLVKVNESAGGDYGFELQWDRTGALWQLLKRTLQSDAEGAEATTGSVTATTGVLAGTGIHTGTEVGDIFRVKNGSGTLLGYFRTTVVGTDQITVSPAPADGTGYTAVRGTRIKNGTTQKSFTCEIANLDVTLFEVLTGMTPGTFSLAVRDGEITTCSFGFAGKQSASQGSSGIAGASYTAAPTTTVMDCKANVQTIRVAGTSYSARSIDMRIENALRSRTVLGSTGAVSIGAGTFRLSGTIEAYFADFTEYTKFVNSTDSSAVLVMQDNAGNAFSFSLPRLKYSGGERPTPGLDQDIILRLPFTALLNTADSEADTVRIQAFAA